MPATAMGDASRNPCHEKFQVLGFKLQVENQRCREPEV
jgi:hypothetical protein